MKKGITLTSLVITVILLIILAGVGIGTLGPDGIIAKAEEAKQQAQIDDEKEIIGTSVVQSAGTNRYGNIEKAELEIYLERNSDDRDIEVFEDGDVLIVNFKDTERYYEVDDEGNVKKLEVVKDENPRNITVGINGEKLDGTADTPYEIWCIEDLIEWSQNYTLYTTSTIKLCTNLNFTSKLSYADSSTTSYGDINTDGETDTLIEEMQKGIGFTPIKTFSGSFDGQTFEVKNIYINASNTAGLFSNVSGAKIENLGITGQITSAAYAGGIVCNVDYKSTVGSKISNCYNKATIVAADGTSISAGTGGICGSSGDVTVIQNCYNAGSISGNACVGGIVGNAGGRIENCYNLGSVYSTETKTYKGVGGIIGLGINKTVVIANCYNGENAKVEGTNSVGGIIGSIKSSSTGISNAKIVNSYNAGQVIGGYNGGGITGDCVASSTTSTTNVEINNAYNHGSVKGNSDTGGILGGTSKTGTLSVYMNNIVNLGAVSQDSTRKGEIVGKVSVTVMEVNNAYYSSTNANKGIGSGTVTGTIEASDIDSNLVTTLNEFVTTYNTENASNTNFDELKMWQINSSTGKLEFK